MAFFRKKGKYWYFIERDNGKEIQHYLGDDEKVKQKLLPKQKSQVLQNRKRSPSKARSG